VSEDTSSQDFISTSKFDRLYINKINEKAIRGYVDEAGAQMSIFYENVGTDVCEIAGQFLKNKFYVLEGTESDYMTCELGFSDDGSKEYIIESSNENMMGIDLSGLWADMTAKIRLDGTAAASNLNENLITSLTDELVSGSTANDVGFPVKLTAALGVASADIVFYRWNFGDGEKISGK
jgi:hypothetical protein